jgi:hypothetical protein
LRKKINSRKNQADKEQLQLAVHSVRPDLSTILLIYSGFA